MPTERKLDIFRVLKAADGKKGDFFESLTDDERKEFQPFLVGRWMSGTAHPAQVCLLNEFFNPYAFALTTHKQLLWQLLTVCNVGKAQRYVWNKLPAKRESGRPNAIRAVREFYGYNTEHAIDALDILTRSQVLEIAENLGWQQEDIAKIRREIKASSEQSDVKQPAPSPSDTLLEF